MHVVVGVFHKWVRVASTAVICKNGGLLIIMLKCPVANLISFVRSYADTLFKSMNYNL